MSVTFSTNTVDAPIGTFVKPGKKEMLTLFVRLTMGAQQVGADNAIDHTDVLSLGPGVFLIDTRDTTVRDCVLAGAVRREVVKEKMRLEIITLANLMHAVEYRGEAHIAYDVSRYDIRQAARVSFIVYTVDRYIDDPDVNLDDPEEFAANYEWVVVAIQAHSMGAPTGPAPLSPTRFMHNVAGGNPGFHKKLEEIEEMNEAEAKEHIRMLQQTAAEGKAYEAEWLLCFNGNEEEVVNLEIGDEYW